MDNRRDSYTMTLRVLGMVLFAAAALFLGRYLMHRGAHGLGQHQMDQEPVQ